MMMFLRFVLIAIQEKVLKISIENVWNLKRVRLKGFQIDIIKIEMR